MDRILTGIGDGCDNCLVKKALWTDISTIDAGFSCDRTLECIKETYEELQKDKEGKVVKSSGDYDVRQGICGKPISLRETFSFTVTHKVKAKLKCCHTRAPSWTLSLQDRATKWYYFLQEPTRPPS